MLTALSKGANSWLVRGLLILIIASFVLWGVEAAHLTGPSTVASVGDVKVTQAEYQRMFRNYQNFLTKDPSEPYTTQKMLADGMDKRVLEQLVMGAALDQGANSLGIRASQSRIITDIHRSPRFQNAAGTFDLAVYRQELSRLGVTEAQYVEEMRKLMERADLVGTLRGGVVVPEAVVQAIYSFESEVRWANYVGIPSAAMTGIPEPTDQDIKAYYDTHKQAYAQPEFRAFRFLVLNQAALAAQTQVTEEQIRKEYEARKATLSSPEKRDLQQIIVADEAAAKKLKQRLDGGEDFAAVAKSAGMSAAEINLPAAEKAKLSYLGDDAANKAFSIPEGQTGDPVNSKLGWVIFKVGTVTPGKEISLEEARPQLMKDIVDKQVAAAMDDLSEKARTQIATGVSIEALAQSLGVPLRTVTKMNGDGKDDIGLQVTGLPPGKNFIPSLFAKTEGEFIDLEDDGETGYFITQLDKIIPAQVTPLDQIKDRVRADWVRDARDKKAEAIAKGIVEKVRGGTSLSDAAAAVGATVSITPPVARAESGKLAGSFSPELLRAMFDAKKDGVVYGRATQGDGYFVIRVAEVKPVPIDQASDSYKQLKRQIGETIKADVEAQYQTYLQDKYSVSRNQKLVDQLVTQMP